MTKATDIGNCFVSLASVVASRLGGVVFTGRRWVLAAAVVASQARSSGDITVHAVQDRFGAATSFVDDSGQLWAWGANADGQYGDGTRDMTVTAKKLGYPEGVTRWSLFRKGARFLALDQDRRLFAWGEPEVARSTPRGSAQAKATLLGTDRWLDVVTPEFQGPFGLGVDQGGRLRWLRAAAPATRDIAPFAEFRTTDATGPDLPAGFASVAAGAHGFLALTTDGRVFAAGIPASGFRGPKAPLVGDTFSDEFFGVPAPAQATRWTRIAAVYDFAMAWADDGKLYTWGDRNIEPFDGSPRVDPVPSPAPPFPGVQSWKAVGGAAVGGMAGSLLALDNRGVLHGSSAPTWLERLGASRGFDVAGARIQFPGSWMPIRGFSQSPAHILVLGADGKVHALGENDDYQLGQPGGGSVWTSYVPLVPGGAAPFLSGAPATLPTLELATLDDLVVEPTTPSLTDGHSGKVQLRGTKGTRNRSSINYSLSTRLTNGLPDPDKTSTNLVQISGLGYGPTEPPGRTVDVDFVPRFDDFQDTPLLVDLVLLPGFDYYLGEHTTATLRYQTTPPQNHPPRARLAWPPLGKRVYFQDSVDFIVEVTDPDGYSADIFLTLLFSAFGDRTMVSAKTPFSLPGTTNLVRLRVKPSIPEYVMYPDIRVTDDRGLSTYLRGGVERLVATSPLRTPPFVVSVQDTRFTLTVPSTTGVLELQSSDDLRTWIPMERYAVPSPGLPGAAVPIEPGPAGNRYLRLVDPTSP